MPAGLLTGILLCRSGGAVPAALPDGAGRAGRHRDHLRRCHHQLVRQGAGFGRVGGGPLGLDGPAAEGL